MDYRFVSEAFILRRYNLRSNKVTLSLLWKKEVSNQRVVVSRSRFKTASNC